MSLPTSSQSYRTKRDAERALPKILQSIEEGSYVEPTKLTVREYLEDKWLPATELRVRPSTLSGYRAAIEAWIVPTLGGRKLQQLDPSDLNALYAQLRASGRRQREGGLSPRSVRYCHTNPSEGAR